MKTEDLKGLEGILHSVRWGDSESVADYHHSLDDALGKVRAEIRRREAAGKECRLDEITVRDVYVPSKHSVAMITAVVAGKEYRHVEVPVPASFSAGEQFSGEEFVEVFSRKFAMSIREAVWKRVNQS